MIGFVSFSYVFASMVFSANGIKESVLASKSLGDDFCLTLGEF